MSKSTSLGFAGALVAMPSSFLAGFILGMAAPVAGVAAMAGLIYAATGKVPFLSHAWPEEGDDRHLSIKLMLPDQAAANFRRERDQIGADFKKMSTEIQDLAEQAQAKAKASMPKPA